MIAAFLLLWSALSKPWILNTNFSQHWSNYRHATNHLMWLQVGDRVLDSQILNAVGEDYGHNTRNLLPGELAYRSPLRMDTNMLPDDLHYDHFALDFTVARLRLALTGAKTTPRSKVFQFGMSDKLFMFMTGHGGDHFIKIRGWADLDAWDLDEALNWQIALYPNTERAWIADSCEMGAIQDQLESYQLYSIASAKKNESSWSTSPNRYLATSMSDTWSSNAYEVFNELVAPICTNICSRQCQNFSFGRYHDEIAKRVQTSRQDQQPTLKASEKSRDPYKVPIIQFFANIDDCLLYKRIERSPKNTKKAEKLGKATWYPVYCGKRNSFSSNLETTDSKSKSTKRSKALLAQETYLPRQPRRVLMQRNQSSYFKFIPLAPKGMISKKLEWKTNSRWWNIMHAGSSLAVMLVGTLLGITIFIF